MHEEIDNLCMNLYHPIVHNNKQSELRIANDQQHTAELSLI